MDQLNIMMENHNMADELRSELRTFFIQRKALNRADREKKIIGMLSPHLKMRAVRKQCEWLRCVPYLMHAGLPLIAVIESKLTGQVAGLFETTQRPARSRRKHAMPPLTASRHAQLESKRRVIA